MQLIPSILNSIENISFPPIVTLSANGANYQQWYALMATRLDRFGVLEDLEYGNLPADKASIVKEFLLNSISPEVFGQVSSIFPDSQSLVTVAPTRLWTAINRIGNSNSTTLVKAVDSQLEQLLIKFPSQFQDTIKSANELFSKLSAAGVEYSDNKKKFMH